MFSSKGYASKVMFWGRFICLFVFHKAPKQHCIIIIIFTGRLCFGWIQYLSVFQKGQKQ